MRFILQGSLESLDELPQFDLPPHAVRYDEPETLEGIARATIPWHIPVLIFIAMGLVAHRLIHGIWSLPTLGGIFTILPLILVHEVIHALFMPRHAEVHCYWSLSHGMAMVTTGTPMTKGRFIVVSLAPLVILGFLPFTWWFFQPPSSFLSRSAMTIGALMMLLSCGDLLNTAMTMRQVPRGGMVQLSGIHTYWYRPNKDV